MAKVLITGIAGFIGSHLAHRLAESGSEVFGIDDFSSGSINNIPFLDPSSCVAGDVSSPERIESMVKRCDVIYHLAAGVGVRTITDYPVETIEGNTLGTINVLRLAGKYRKKVFIASSSEVYGKLNKGFLKETDSILLGPPGILRWGYGCSKLLCEYLAVSYYRKRGLPVVIGRFFNVCGPRQTGAYGMVVPRFINAALSGMPITVYGTGEQVRSFTYVSDIVSAMISLMQVKEAEGDVFNIGGERGITINELAYMVKRITASTSSVVHMPYEDAYGDCFEDMPRRVPDISKLKRISGFSPRIPVEEMLKRIISYEGGTLCRESL